MLRLDFAVLHSIMKMAKYNDRMSIFHYVEYSSLPYLFVHLFVSHLRVRGDSGQNWILRLMCSIKKKAGGEAENCAIPKSGKF